MQNMLGGWCNEGFRFLRGGVLLLAGFCFAACGDDDDNAPQGASNGGSGQGGTGGTGSGAGGAGGAGGTVGGTGGTGGSQTSCAASLTTDPLSPSPLGLEVGLFAALDCIEDQETATWSFGYRQTGAADFTAIATDGSATTLQTNTLDVGDYEFRVVGTLGSSEYEKVIPFTLIESPTFDTQVSCTAELVNGSGNLNGISTWECLYRDLDTALEIHLSESSALGGVGFYVSGFGGEGDYQTSGGAAVPGQINIALRAYSGDSYVDAQSGFSEPPACGLPSPCSINVSESAAQSVPLNSFGRVVLDINCAQLSYVVSSCEPPEQMPVCTLTPATHHLDLQCKHVAE